MVSGSRVIATALALGLALASFSAIVAADDAAAHSVDPQASLPPWLRNAAADEAAQDDEQQAPAQSNETVSEVDSNADARVVLTSIILHPNRGVGQRQQVGIKNMGDAPIDLEGWRLTNEPEKNDTGFVFGETHREKCLHVKTVVPSKGTAVYHAKEAAGRLPCTLNFDLAKGQTLKLFDPEGNLKANLKLDFNGGGEYALAPGGGDYWNVQSNKGRTLMETIDRMGHFKHFARILRHFQFDRALAGLGRKRWQSCGPVAYYPYYACHTQYDEEYGIYYRNAPFTVFAPTDEAIERMLKDMGGSYPGAVPLTMEEYLSLDDGQVASDMAKYHVIKGYELTTKFIQPNSTLPFVHLPTNRNNSEIVAFVDYRSHSMCVHKDCVEAHTQDEFGCGQQVAWNKCEEDWMNDAGLFSRRELGYCEISCGKCEKTAETCMDVPIKDILAKNGVLHGIGAVLPIPEIIPVYVPPPPPEPEPEPEPEIPEMPTYGGLGLTNEMEDSTEMLGDLIELYLASRRERRERQANARVIDSTGK